MIKPQKLKQGDKVATVSLSWGGPSIFPQRYHIGVQQLQQEFGLQVMEMPNTLKDAGWLAKNPKARADDLCKPLPIHPLREYLLPLVVKIRFGYYPILISI